MPVFSVIREFGIQRLVHFLSLGGSEIAMECMYQGLHNSKHPQHFLPDGAKIETFETPDILTIAIKK